MSFKPFSKRATRIELICRKDGKNVDQKTVLASVITDFYSLKDTIQKVFPTLREAEFQITWNDGSNEEITIISNEDFQIALREMAYVKIILYVTVSIAETPGKKAINKRTAAPNKTAALPGTRAMPSLGAATTSTELVIANTSGLSSILQAICDACDQTITGLRYKCLQCPDYDLCARCKHQGYHREHIMCVFK